jgi:hypothetical protein
MDAPNDLYHRRRHGGGVELDWLDPTTAPSRHRNGREGQFLYATPRLDQAILYALPFPGGGGKIPVDGWG